MFHQPHFSTFMGSIAVALACISGMTPVASAQSVDVASKEPMVHASGTGRVQRVPDYVDVSIGIEVIESTASAAQSGAESVMKATVAAIRAMKLANEELQTGSVDLSPRYERSPGDGTPAKVIGYTGSISLNIRTTNLESPAGIIDVALKSGCNRVNHVSFGIKELLSAREEAITLATKAAKRKAEVMAGALDMKLTRVVNASTSAVNHGWWGGSNRLGNLAQVATGNAGGDGGEGSAVVPGKIEVMAEVTITFAAAANG